MGQWFSKSTQTAKVIYSNANTNVLRSALRNYINAVKALQGNARTNAEILKQLNVNSVNVGNNTTMKNRIAKGIAKIVVASKNTLWGAAAAAAGAPGAPSETAAAGNVINLTANINSINASITAANANSLNKIMAKLIKNSGGTLNASGNPAAYQPANVAKAYAAIRRNKLNVNAKLNSTRMIKGFLGRKVPSPARWQSIFKAVGNIPPVPPVNMTARMSVNVPGRQNKAVLKKSPNGKWVFNNTIMNTNFKIVNSNTNKPSVQRKTNNNQGPKPASASDPRLVSIKAIVNNTSLTNNKAKMALIKTRFPNAKYYNLSEAATNAETKRILRLLSNETAAASTVAQAIAGVKKNNTQKQALGAAAQMFSGPNTNIYKKLRELVLNAPSNKLINKNSRSEYSRYLFTQQLPNYFLNQYGNEPQWNAAYNRLMANAALQGGNKTNQRNFLKRLYFTYKKTPKSGGKSRPALTNNLNGINYWNQYIKKYPST